MQCENCGNDTFKEDKGILTCTACGSSFKTEDKGHINFEEELREKEIRRLLTNKRAKPDTRVLTEEDILKYAPDSSQALHIKASRTDSLWEKIKIYRDLIFAIIPSLIFFSIIIVVCLYGLFGK